MNLEEYLQRKLDLNKQARFITVRGLQKLQNIAGINDPKTDTELFNMKKGITACQTKIKFLNREKALLKVIQTMLLTEKEQKQYQDKLKT